MHPITITCEYLLKCSNPTTIMEKWKIVDPQHNQQPKTRSLDAFSSYVGNVTIDDTNSGTQKLIASFTIPAEAFKKAASSGSSGQFFAIYYKDPELFSSVKPAKVLALSFGVNISVTSLSPSLRVSYEDELYNRLYNSTKEIIQGNQRMIEKYRLECVYWEFKINDWSRDGCCWDQSQNPPVCQCNHLTNFALLVTKDVVPVTVPLQVISLVGCVFVSVVLVIVFIIYVINADRRKLKSTHAILNICVNMLVTYIIFAAGITQSNNQIVCTTITALYQFFFLVMWSWMCAYSYCIYSSITIVYSEDEDRFFLLKSYFLSYFLPLLITFVNLLVSVGYFDTIVDVVTCDGRDPLAKSTYTAGSFCWLHGFSLYFGFLLPGGIMLIINLILLALVLRKVKYAEHEISSTKAKLSANFNIVISMVFFGTSVICWPLTHFMLIYTGPEYFKPLNWVVAGSTFLQGLLIFFATCVYPTVVMESWTNRLFSLFGQSETYSMQEVNSDQSLHPASPHVQTTSFLY